MRLPWRLPKRRSRVVRPAPDLFDELLAQAAFGSLPQLLTQLSMLARDIKSPELQQWADLEANGYFVENPAMTETVRVPEYRAVAGQWRDEAGRPLVLQDPELHFVNQTPLRQSVAELEQLATRSDTLSMQDAHGASLIQKHFQVQVIWFVFSSSAIAGILTAIRARLLDWLYQVRPTIEQMRSSGQRRIDLAHLADAPYLADSTALHDHIRRIEQSIESDPAQAIGSAKELVETAAKHVLQHCGEDPDAYDKFARLVKAAVARLDLPSEAIPEAKQGAQALAMLTGGLGQIAEGTAALRNLYGTGHGRTRAAGAEARHVRLVVGACATLTAFLLDTLEARKAGRNA